MSIDPKLIEAAAKALGDARDRMLALACADALAEDALEAVKERA